MLPQDPFILLSFLNTKLRDCYASLEELCGDAGAETEDIIEKMERAGFRYDREHNQFKKGARNMSDCLFCRIIAGEIPSSKVYEDELCYAFNDIDPQAPTHFLVIPKEHIRSCGAVTPENSAVVAHIFEVISKVCSEQGLTDFRVVSNCGQQAGQSVPHLHFHVLSGRDMTWPPG